MASFSLFVAGGGVTSLIMRAMLTRMGLRRTLLSYFGINTAVFIVAFFLLKSPRPTRQVERIDWIDRAQFRDPVFWSFAISIFVTDL